jgi:hypothetical protein
MSPNPRAARKARFRPSFAALSKSVRTEAVDFADVFGEKLARAHGSSLRDWPRLLPRTKRSSRASRARLMGWPPGLTMVATGWIV